MLRSLSLNALRLALRGRAARNGFAQRLAQPFGQAAPSGARQPKSRVRGTGWFISFAGL
jgi:hypothetical protein